jgi:hypothetical protein
VDRAKAFNDATRIAFDPDSPGQDFVFTKLRTIPSTSSAWWPKHTSCHTNHKQSVLAGRFASQRMRLGIQKPTAEASEVSFARSTARHLQKRQVRSQLIKFNIISNPYDSPTAIDLRLVRIYDVSESNDMEEY